MKFKKLLASSLLCGLCIFSSIPVHASEVEGPDTGIQRTEAALTDGVTRASWGTGTLIHENPLIDWWCFLEFRYKQKVPPI